MREETILVQDLNLSGELPDGYYGQYQRHIVVRTGDAYTVLDVYSIAAGGEKVFLRSFRGPMVEDAEDEFNDWLLCQWSRVYQG